MTSSATSCRQTNYVLGCFADWAIADATGWPMSLIQSSQQNEAFAALGEAMTDEHVRKLAGALVSYDGYGHHFAHYDGSEHELIIDGDDWYAFRVN